MTEWTPAEAASLYNVANWSGGYFAVNGRGNVVARPDGAPAPGEPPGAEIDLLDLVRQIRRRGIEAPVLLRFDGILRARVRELSTAFEHACTEFGFGGSYSTVFPIKVNQQRHLVDVLVEAGEEHGMGLEVGSKPELLAVMGLHAEEGRLIVCNGYKDADYVETALLTSRLGTSPVLVVEKPSELQTILDTAEALGIRPILGVRTKLGQRGSGRWSESGGDRSKFGLTTRQIVQMVEELRSRDMLDCLRLLHFHLGSQITRIRTIKDALNEATRTLVGLHEMGVEIEWFDVGGGLGVDYDGSSTTGDSSMNYSVQEYANDVVYALKGACEDGGLPEPTILSESGRALTAHHAVLVTEVLGVSNFTSVGEPETPDEHEHELVHEFAETCRDVDEETYLEAYHDAMQLREQGMTLFQVGQLTLPDRARVEELFWHLCQKVLEVTRRLDYVPEELARLERDMADTYYLNFSVFQSMPDSWAIQQLFPIMPLHRLDEEPTRRAVLADITCDSDGKIDHFIDRRAEKHTLELHPPVEGEHYYVGHFLVGAYQEILGDMHNLFGDTHVVHVEVNGAGRPRLVHIVPGDKVSEVLSYVEYFAGDLTAALRRNVERAIDQDRISLEESARLTKHLANGLDSYTYLLTPELLEDA